MLRQIQVNITDICSERACLYHIIICSGYSFFSSVNMFILCPQLELFLLKFIYH